MSERIRGSYDDALYKSTYTLLYFILYLLTYLFEFWKSSGSYSGFPGYRLRLPVGQQYEYLRCYKISNEATVGFTFTL